MGRASLLAGKRVLFMLCGFELGGAERQALYLAKHLKSLGCDVRVWGHHHHRRGPERVISICEELGIPCSEYKFRWPCGKIALVKGALRLLRGLYRERPDIIIPYLPWPSVGCGLVWRWSPARVCIWGQRNCGDLRGDAVERFAYRRASAVICNASHEVAYLEQALGRAAAPVHVVNNGVDLPPAKQSSEQWRVKLGVGRDTTLAVMAANFREQKDHPTLLRSWKALLDRDPSLAVSARLVLPGAPLDSYESVQSLYYELGLGDAVLFPGQVQDMAGLLGAGDIGVLATHFEGLPNAILEYMTCGLPVVATDIPGNREALGDGAGEQLCGPGDAESLASKLEPFLRDRELRSRLAARNLERAKSEFTIERMCASTTKVLEGLLLSAGGQTKRQTG
jgi:glycosyltransferase involved in cell wall biosynthesis